MCYVDLPVGAPAGLLSRTFPALQLIATNFGSDQGTLPLLHELFGHPSLQELFLGWIAKEIQWLPALRSMPRLRHVELMMVDNCLGVLSDVAAASSITSIRMFSDGKVSWARLRSQLAQHAPSRLQLQQVASRLQVLELQYCDMVYLDGPSLVGLLRALPALRKLRAAFAADDVTAIDGAVRQVCRQQGLLVMVMGGQEGSRSIPQRDYVAGRGGHEQQAAGGP